MGHHELPNRGTTARNQAQPVDDWAELSLDERIGGEKYCGGGLNKPAILQKVWRSSHGPKPANRMLLCLVVPNVGSACRAARTRPKLGWRRHDRRCAPTTNDFLASQAVSSRV